MTINEFLNGIAANANRVTHYENGGSGSGGACDCIG